jgi:hypothetical protein
MVVARFHGLIVLYKNFHKAVMDYIKWRVLVTPRAESVMTVT